MRRRGRWEQGGPWSCPRASAPGGLEDPALTVVLLLSLPGSLGDAGSNLEAHGGSTANLEVLGEAGNEPKRLKEVGNGTKALEATGAGHEVLERLALGPRLLTALVLRLSKRWRWTRGSPQRGAG